jgi:hypothetical protein
MIPYNPNPYAGAPVATPPPPGRAVALPPGARVEDGALVMPNGGALPPVCLKCGATNDLAWRKVKFSYVPPWARFLGAIIQVFVIKRSRFLLPLCRACNQGWRKWNLLVGFSWVPGVALGLLGAGVGTIVGDSNGVGLAVGFMVAGAVAILVLLITAAVLRGKRVLAGAPIDKTHTWIQGVERGVLEMWSGALANGVPYPALAYPPVAPSGEGPNVAAHAPAFPPFEGAVPTTQPAVVPSTSRARALSYLLVSLLLPFALGFGGSSVGVAIQSDGLVGASVTTAFLLLIAAVVLLWVNLFRGSKDLAEAGRAWLSGDLEGAETRSLRTLRRVFRSDFRMASIHQVGLCAEARGDFDVAEVLFARAVRATPFGIRAAPKARARALALGHRALALAARGRLEEWQIVHGEALKEAFRPTQSTAFAGLLYASWANRLFENVMRNVEPGRDPRAVVALAHVVGLYRARAYRELVGILASEAQTLTQGLLPREQALVQALGTRARQGLEGMRAGVAPSALPDPTSQQWVERTLGTLDERFPHEVVRLR